MTEQSTIKTLSEEEIRIWKECKSRILVMLDDLIKEHDQALVIKGARAALWDVSIRELPTRDI